MDCSQIYENGSANNSDFINCLKSQDCIPCPNHGTCKKDGSLTCDKGYTKAKGDNGKSTCVESAEIKKEAYLVARRYEKYLQQLRGEYDCGSTVPYIHSYKDLEMLLIKQHLGSSDSINDMSSAEVITAKAHVGLVLRQFDLIKDEFDIKSYHAEGGNSTEDLVLYASTGRKSLSCFFKEWIWAHIYKVVSVFAVTGLALQLTSNYRKSEAVNALAADFFKTVKKQLEDLKN